MNLFNRNTSRDGFCASMRARRDTKNVATEKSGGSIPSAELSGIDAAPAREVSDRMTARSVDCDHAWVLNVKPAVCLWCGARKQSR